MPHSMSARNKMGICAIHSSIPAILPFYCHDSYCSTSLSLSIRLFFYKGLWAKNNEDSPVAQMVENFACNMQTQVQCLGQEDPLEKGMATHSSILVWRIPRTVEPGRLQGGLKEQLT